MARYDHLSGSANIYDPTTDECQVDPESEELPFGISIKTEGDHDLIDTDSLSYEQDDKDWVQNLKNMGLPTSFGGPQSMSSSRRAKKRKYFCDLCYTELNSEETIQSHLQGMAHLRKLQAFRAKQKKGETVAPTTYLNQHSDQISRPKKKPPKLATKMVQTRQPIVGLKYVTEIIPCSNAEMDPHYECSLCKFLDNVEGMLSHLLSRRHRVNYLETRFGKDFHNVASSQLERELEQYKENDNLEKMTTLYSDEQYPWPPGTAPWSIEKGGTGVEPTYGRHNTVKEEDTGEVEKPTARLVIKGLPFLINEGDVNNHLTQLKKLLKNMLSFHRLRIAVKESDLTALEKLESQVQTLIGKLNEVKIKAILRGDSSAPTFKVSNKFVSSAIASPPQESMSVCSGSPRSQRSGSTSDYQRRPRSSRDRSRSPRDDYRRRRRSSRDRSRSKSPHRKRHREYRSRSPAESRHGRERSVSGEYTSYSHSRSRARSPYDSRRNYY